MAIHKVITTIYGGNAEHHIFEEIHILRTSDKIHVYVNPYYIAASFNAGSPPYPPTEILKDNISSLSAEIKATIQTLKEQLETYVINNSPKYEFGTRVQDDGTPV